MIRFLILLTITTNLFSITQDDILDVITNTTSIKDFSVNSPIINNPIELGGNYDVDFDQAGITYNIDPEFNRIHKISIIGDAFELNRGIKLGTDLFTVTSSRNDAYEILFTDDGRIEGVVYRLQANPYEEFIQTFFVDATNRVNKIDLNINSPRYIDETINKVLGINPLREIDFVLFDTDGSQIKWNNNFIITDKNQYTYRGIKLGSLDITIKGMYRDSDATINYKSDDKYDISYSYADDDNIYTLKYSLNKNRVIAIELSKSIL